MDVAAVDLETRLKEIADKLTVALDQLIPPAEGPEADLMRAMRHAALANGRRLRPFYLLECGRMFEAAEMSLLRVAAALECVHTYSQVHDDLPCMDDDDFRRGQPTVHKAFDEATAVLAGDALLSLAFKILANADTHPDANVRLILIERLSDAAGPRGMVGGQMIDMLGPDAGDDLHTLTRMQRLKTGSLFGYATEAAGLLGGASEAERQSLAGFANDLGLAYQIADDVNDVEADAALGAETSRQAKSNFVTLLGMDGARQRVRMLAEQAKQHLAIFRNRANILLQSVDYVLERQH
ncbi:MAG: polyprenyl synthetase family protein [Pseudomonadota bacterium]